MNESEHRRLLAKAKARYEADLEAIERIRRMDESDKRPRTPRVSESAKATNDGPLPAAASDDVPEFDLPDVNPFERARVEGSVKRRRGSLDKTIRTIVADIEVGVFTIKDVERKLNDPTVDRSSMSAVLKRLADSDELEVVEAGRGRRPTKYQKAA